MLKNQAARRTPRIQSIDPNAARFSLPQCFALVDRAGLVLATASTLRKLTEARKRNPAAEAVVVYAVHMKETGT